MTHPATRLITPIPQTYVPILQVPNRSLDSVGGTKYLTMSAAQFFNTSLDKKKFAISIWLKPDLILIPRAFYGIGGGTPTSATCSAEIRSNKLELKVYSGSSTYFVNGSTTVVTDSWQHCLLIWDSAQVVAADRMQLYLDGSKETISSSSLPPQNTDANQATTDATVNKGASLAYDGLSYQPAFFNGSVPDIGDLYEAGSPKPLTELSGLHSLLFTNDIDDLEDDYILTNNWTNTNSVTKSTDIPI